MPCPKNGPCNPFISDGDLCCLEPGGMFPDPCLTGGQPVSFDKVQDAIQAASELMWAATGRQFGTCTVKLRPCRRDNGCNPCPDGGEIPSFSSSDFGYGFGYPWYPLHTQAGWINVAPCGCKSSCGCEELCEIKLPYPVCCIDEVKVDGITLGPENYRVDDFEYLVRIGTIPVEVDDWSILPINSPSPLVTGDLTLSGPLSTQLFQPLLSETKVRILGPGVVTWLLGNQANDEPGDPCIEIQFDSFGDTATVANPIVVAGVSGPASYDPMTGVITYAGQNSPPRVDPELVKVCYLQSVKTASITFDQPAWIHSFSWTDLHPTGDVNCWPKCQDLTKEDTEDGTFSITVTYGREVPQLVKLGTAELACQLLKACVGAPCQLPQRIQSVTRQGISVSFLDTMDFLDKGMTGLYQVDLAIRTYNPHRLMRRPGVYSPDVANRWRRVGTGGSCG